MTDGIQDKAMPESPECWLSILIPVFNVAPYVQECVLSVMNQQPDTGVEVILLDDCSSDNSWQICQDIAGQFPDTIRLMQHTQNRGLSAARNSMLDKAKGKYVWFLDSDDYLIGDSITQLKKIINVHAPDLVLFDYKKKRLISVKKSFPGFSSKTGTDQRHLIAGVFGYRKMYAWLKISKRSLWADDLRFPAGKLFEDIATTPYLLLRARKYHYVPKAWVFYRMRPNSIMTSFSRVAKYFDTSKHRDMAQSLLGYKEKLWAQIDRNEEDVNFAVSHFIAIEFSKLAKRYKSAKNIPNDSNMDQDGLFYYYTQMQLSSPYPFDVMQHKYLKMFLVWRYYALRRAVKWAVQEKRNCK